MPAVKMSAAQIRQRKGANQTPIVAVTAYDYTMAKLLDELVDIVLVGDSLGMVMQGNDTTLGVTVDDVIYHTKCVRRALKFPHLVADMPFMSYQVSPEEALRNAGRVVSESGAEAVKLEGGVELSDTIERLVKTGIPVMGHIGLTPQSVHVFGGYKVQGKTPSQKESILQDALALEDAGAYCVVMEGIPSDLGDLITQRLKIPTIGIGAGNGCDGQILVLQDLLGMNPQFKPRFVKKFETLSDGIHKAVSQYATEVRERTFPDREHSFENN